MFQETEDEIQVEKSSYSNIPGTQKIYVKTWGCAHNSSDSEYMAGQLAAFGYRLTQDKNEADLWLLNSCTVKNPAEDHFRNEIESGQKQGKNTFKSFVSVTNHITNYVYFVEVECDKCLHYRI